MWFPNAGNNTVGRITTNVTPNISHLTPTSGTPGTTVIIPGRNLSDATAVAFNGTQSTIVSENAQQIVTTVPTGATTGPVTVSTPAGTATSTGTFTVTP